MDERSKVPEREPVETDPTGQGRPLKVMYSAWTEIGAFGVSESDECIKEIPHYSIGRGFGVCVTSSGCHYNIQPTGGLNTRH